MTMMMTIVMMMKIAMTMTIEMTIEMMMEIVMTMTVKTTTALLRHEAVSKLLLLVISISSKY